MAIKRERKRMYSADERKRKAAAEDQTTYQGHGEEPEFLPAIRKKRSSLPPNQHSARMIGRDWSIACDGRVQAQC